LGFAQAHKAISKKIGSSAKHPRISIRGIACHRLACS